MVQPTVLKKRHSLVGVKLLPVIKNIRGGKPEGLKEFARMNKDKSTEALKVEEISALIRGLTGESMEELLELAGRDVAVEEARWMLHCLIVFANEFGQPKGQVLDDAGTPCTSASQDGESAPPAPSGSSMKKRKLEASDDLEDRISSLEKASRVEAIKDLKEKVRTLCLQDEPSNALILLTLDDLAKSAHKAGHEDADIFEELYRQANRYQSKIQISNLCLSVLGGKAADAISKAISKCLKEKPESQSDCSKDNAGSQKKSESPLSGLYAPSFYPMNMMPAAGMFPNMMNMGGYSGYGNQAYRGNRQGYRPYRPKGNCHFCNSNTHQIKDCEKMKLLKEK